MRLSGAIPRYEEWFPGREGVMELRPGQRVSFYNLTCPTPRNWQAAGLDPRRGTHLPPVSRYRFLAEEIACPKS